MKIHNLCFVCKKGKHNEMLYEFDSVNTANHNKINISIND